MIYLYGFAVNPFAQVRRLSSSKENRTRKGMIVTEANYRTGLANGLFRLVFAGKPTKYKKTDNLSSESPAKKTIEEEDFRRGFWRRAGELVCEEAFKDESKRKMIKTQIDIFLLNDVMKTLAEMKSGSSM